MTGLAMMEAAHAFRRALEWLYLGLLSTGFADPSIQQYPANCVGDYHLPVGSAGDFQPGLGRRKRVLAQLVPPDLGGGGVEDDGRLRPVGDKRHAEGSEGTERRQ